MLASSGDGGTRVVYFGVSEARWGEDTLLQALLWVAHGWKEMNEKYLGWFILSMQPYVMILIFCRDTKKIWRHGGNEE